MELSAVLRKEAEFLEFAKEFLLGMEDTLDTLKSKNAQVQAGMTDLLDAEHEEGSSSLASRKKAAKLASFADLPLLPAKVVIFFFHPSEPLTHNPLTLNP